VPRHPACLSRRNLCVNRNMVMSSSLVVSPSCHAVWCIHAATGPVYQTHRRMSRGCATHIVEFRELLVRPARAVRIGGMVSRPAWPGARLRASAPQGGPWLITDWRLGDHAEAAETVGGVHTAARGRSGNAPR